MIAALLAAAALAAGGPFDYDPSVPLDVREAGSSVQRDARVVDLSYAAPGGSRVPAFLVLPQRPGPLPAVIAQPGGFGGRDSGLFEAAELARHGLAVLTIDGPQARVPRTRFACTSADVEEFRRYVVELRRGIDLLQSRPEVDGSRLGYTGFSFGAEVGGALVGVDHRLKAVALQSGSGRLSTVWRGACSRAPKRMWTAFRRLDPINFIARARPAALLIQNGRYDGTFPRAEVLALHRTASRPKTVRWYASRHTLPAAASYARDAFLARALGAASR
jgi:dienelactone hydrolase